MLNLPKNKNVFNLHILNLKEEIITKVQETGMRRNMVRITATRVMKQRMRLQDSADMNAAVGQIKNAK